MGIKKYRPKLMVFVILLVSFLLSSLFALETNSKPLFVGVAKISDQGLDETFIEKALEFFELQMGRKIVLRQMHGVMEVLEELERNALDFAFVSSFAFGTLIDEDKIEYVATKLTLEKDIFYRLIFVTSAHSKINKIQDLQGKRIGFPDKFSEAAYLFSKKYLVRKNLVADNKDLFQAVFFDTYDQILKGLKNGEIEGAYLPSDCYYKNWEDLKLLSVSSEKFPNAAFVANKDTTTRELREKILLVFEQFSKVDPFGLLRLQKADPVIYKNLQNFID